MDAGNHTRTAGNQPHIVIPYSYADHEMARKLAGALRRERVTPWIDDVDMSAGVILINRIARAARPVDFVVPVISAASVAADWVRHDLKTIITMESNVRPVRVLLARVDSTSLPDYLKSQSCLDFHGRGWNQALADLTAIVFRRGAGPKPPLRPKPEFALPHALRRPQPAAEKKPARKVVFVSYDYENDGHYKDILLTWSNAPDFPQLRFNDQPITTPVDGEEAQLVKRMISAKIDAATGFLCVVGPKTCANPWVDWEIKAAIDREKRMIVARVNRDCAVPDALSEVGPTCALSFTFEGIKRAVGEAYGVVAEE